MGKGKLLAGIAAMFAIYVAAAPYIAVHQMKSAAESRDGEALSEYIEFPSVRQSLKDQMNAVFMKEMTTELEDNPFAAVHPQPDRPESLRTPKSTKTVEV